MAKQVAYTPPRLALRFFRWYCRPKLADHIEGDLIEAYQEDASVPRLLRLLTKDFVVLVAIACGIAIPVAYFFMNEWLTRYDYRTDIPWSIFAMTSAGALIITLFTVSFQAINAAFMNPVKSLRSE